MADRTGVMDEHLRSVQSELSFTQQRLTAKGKEVQSEAHLRALGEREAARLDADARRLCKERGELKERVLGLQSQIYRANERMDQFRVRAPAGGSPAARQLMLSVQDLSGQAISDARRGCRCS